MRLYIPMDLCKNIVTIDGQKYDVQHEQKDGYEAYVSSKGETLFRKLVGQGATPAPAETGVETGEIEEKVEKDPLKEGKPEPAQVKMMTTKDQRQQLADLGHGKEDVGKMTPDEAQQNIDSGKTVGKDPDLKLDRPDSPFDIKADHKDTSPMEHYHGANLADRLGDSKMAQFHREQARAKHGDADSVEHADIRDQLKAAGYHEDADHHHGEYNRIINEKAGPVVERGKESASAANEATTSEDAKMKAKAAKMKARRDDRKPQTAITENLKPAANYKAEEAKLGTADTARDPGQSLKQQQMAGQKRAKEEFDTKAKEFEDQTQEAEAATAQHEKDLKAFEDAKEIHGAELNRLSDKLKRVKEGAPVVNDKNVNKISEQISALKRDIEAHKDDAPSDAHIKKQKAGIKKVTSKAPKRRTNESDAAFEKRAKKFEKKVSGLEAQLSTMEQSHESNVASHAKKAKGLRAKGRKLAERFEAAKKKMKADYTKAKEKHGKKVKAAKEKYDSYKDSAKDIKKPDKPKVKPPEQTHKAPETDQEKMTHEDHRKTAGSMRENIESHLNENQDMDEDIRQRLVKLHEQASYHENVLNVPTKDQVKELKDLGKRAKEHDADRPHAEVKAERDEKEAKVQEKEQRAKGQAEKKAAVERENTPRPPEDDMDRAAIHQHITDAQQSLDNINSHLEDGDVDEEAKQHLEGMVEKLQEHADLGTVPTKDQIAELKQVQKLTKEHSSKNWNDTPEGKEDAESGAVKEEEPAESKTSARRTTGSVRRMGRGAMAWGSKVGAAAASPYEGGSMGSLALEETTSGAFTLGHHLLDNKKKQNTKQGKKKDTPEDLRISSKEEKEMSKLATSRAKPQDSQKSITLRHYIEAGK
jgi:hypothetical protein